MTTRLSPTLLRDGKELILPPDSLTIDGAKRGMDLVNLQMLGMVPTVSGGATRGTNTEGDVLTQTADGRDLNDIWREFVAALNFHNADRQMLINLLTFPVTALIEDVPQAGGEDFEEASEFGEPVGIRAVPTYFSMGYDFKWYDLAVRFTWKFLAEASGAQVDALNNVALEADNRLVFSKVMRAVFNNVNRQTDIRGQNIPVYPFYNADGTVPPTFKNYTHDGTHTHYLTSGAAVIDSGDLDDLETHLVHHGYGRENGSNLVVLMNRAQVATVRTFRVSTGASYDFIPAVGSPAFLAPPDGIIGGRPAATYQGLTVAGSYGPWTIIEEDYIPVGYVMAFATGGILAATNPVGLREHVNAALRGLRIIPGSRAGYPLLDSFYNRGFGTGIRHRGAGVVMQITANAAYAIPAAYA